MNSGAERTLAISELLQLATVEIGSFLNQYLPALNDAWWEELVLARLSFQQERIAREQGFQTLADLDLAALLRILDQNWYELTGLVSLPREARSWVKELQIVRNKWSHLSSRTVAPNEVYRDADTLGLLMNALGASANTMRQIDSAKANAIRELADAEPSPKTTTVNAHPGTTESTIAAESTSPSQSTHAASLYAVGDLVSLRSNPDQVMPVLAILESDPSLRRYQVFQNNRQAVYYESQLQPIVTAPHDRRVLNSDELRAALTSLQLLSPSTANIYSLRSGRVKYIPYQYRPVMRLIRADRPRLLIADEVGVGKTIEAGLIMRELQARMDLSRVLIICPKALVAERKWYVEMKRFDERFTALDGPGLRYCLEETHLDGEWPLQQSRAIIPFSLFDADLLHGHARQGRVQSRGLLALDPPPKFDLVIVDEAHHIRNPETYLHQGIRYFCDNADAVVFLTATPVQLGSEDLYTLLNVLRPDLIIDQNSFAQMAEPNTYINAAVQSCRAGDSDWEQQARISLEHAAETDWGRVFLRESPSFQQAYDALSENDLTLETRIKLTRSIEELYTFSSLINRTRRRDIGDFTLRKPETLEVPFTSSQQHLHDTLLDIIARILTAHHGSQNVKFMMTTIRRQAASCLYGLNHLLEDILLGKLQQFDAPDDDGATVSIDPRIADQLLSDVAQLLEEVRALDSYDPKVEAFLQVLQEKQSLGNNKALVFSTFRHTLAYLASAVSLTDIRFGVIHGNVLDWERAELRQRFALPKEDLQALDLLLSSEVGCEGLDFQFCDMLINYDLPWNPMRIEQRIGRIDRYGQESESVAVVNLITPGTVDADIYHRCLWRIGVFQRAIGGNEEILGEISQEIGSIAQSFELTADQRRQKLQQVADNHIRQIQEEQHLESRQAELFGLSIPKPDWEDELEAGSNFWLSPQSIQNCVVEYLAGRLGKDHEYLLGEKPTKTLRLNQHARNSLLEDFRRLPSVTDYTYRVWEKWLKDASPTLTVTFEQDIAAQSSTVTLLSVAHPLVRQAAHYLQPLDPVYAALTVTADAPAGHHLFAVYQWTKHGVKRDEQLVAVATDTTIERELFALLKSATATEDAQLPPASAFDDLDASHHEQWIRAQANHIAENRQLVEFRTHSLTVSHSARRNIISDQIERATNAKIQLMRRSELARAEADYERRMAELSQAAESGDIHATPVLFGTLVVEN